MSDHRQGAGSLELQEHCRELDMLFAEHCRLCHVFLATASLDPHFNYALEHTDNDTVEERCRGWQTQRALMYVRAAIRGQKGEP